MLHLYFLFFELVPKWNKLNFYILINSFINFIILVYLKSELIKSIINSLFLNLICNYYSYRISSELIYLEHHEEFHQIFGSEQLLFLLNI